MNEEEKDEYLKIKMLKKIWNKVRLWKTFKKSFAKFIGEYCDEIIFSGVGKRWGSWEWYWWNLSKNLDEMFDVLG